MVVPSLSTASSNNRLTWYWRPRSGERYSTQKPPKRRRSRWRWRRWTDWAFRTWVWPLCQWEMWDRRRLEYVRISYSCKDSVCRCAVRKDKTELPKQSTGYRNSKRLYNNVSSLSKSGVLINDIPWSGLYFVMHNTKRVTRCTWNPLPLEFQASTCVFKDLTTSSMSNSLPLLTNCGRVMKWAGIRCAPFSTSRYIDTMAWTWTRIDLYTFTKHYLNVL